MSLARQRDRRIPPLFIACVAAVLVSGLHLAGSFERVESVFEDLLFSPRALDTRLVIATIDNEALEKIGQWPWPRAVFVKALTHLNTAPPRVVGLDVIFADPSRVGPVDDFSLQQSIKSIDFPLVMPIEADRLTLVPDTVPVWATWQTSKLTTPLSRFLIEPQVTLGHVNLVLDSDGVARRIPFRIALVTRDDRGEEMDGKQAFAWKVADLVHSLGTSSPRETRIVYAGPPGTVPHVSFAKIYEGDAATLAQLKDRIVFIGATAPDLHDEQITPVSRGRAMSGVEIQAQIVNMLLKEYRLTSLPQTAMLMLIFLASLIPALLFSLIRRSSLAFGSNVIIGILYLPLTIYLFNQGHVVHFVHLQLAWFLSTAALFGHRYMTIERDRRQMRNAFSKYVSKDVLEEILANPEKVKLGGDEKEATVFFSDVRGFTTLSETMTPTQLVEFLNKYLSRMTDIMLAERGVVDKYIGDAIMGFWGAPIPTRTHALDAVRASLIMVDALAVFNEESKARGELEIDIGIGLNTGKVTAGNMGSTQRFDYTVMGDTVNLASRLEGQTKSYGIHMLISENTYAALPKETLEKENILIRELDQIKVKGKKLPVRVFQVVDPAKTAAVRAIVPKFNQLREEYYRGAWQTCIALAEGILKQVDDGPTKALLERACYFAEHPPEHWEGVYELKTK